MDDPTTGGIQGYHAHVYYEPGSRSAAEGLAEAVADRFAVEVGGFVDEPAGPHPQPNLPLIFATSEFAALVPWLMQNRNGLDVLIHALTDDSVRDHSSDALWLGNPVPLRLHRLRPGYRPALLPPA